MIIANTIFFLVGFGIQNSRPFFITGSYNNVRHDTLLPDMLSTEPKNIGKN